MGAVSSARVIVQRSASGSYRAPVLKKVQQVSPPQMIISVPVQTAEWYDRGSGAPSSVVAVQRSVVGSYRPPLFELPPQTIISVPVHTAVCPAPPPGAARPRRPGHRGRAGSYRPA